MIHFVLSVTIQKAVMLHYRLDIQIVFKQIGKSVVLPYKYLRFA